MFTHRRSARRLLTVVVSALLMVLAAPVAAMADTPVAWEDRPDTSGFDYLLVLLLIPGALAIAIAVLAALPSMIGDRGYEPGRSWGEEPEWFGGPRKGVEAAEQVDPKELEGQQGGTSARW